MFSEIWRNWEITELLVKGSDGKTIILQVADQQDNYLRMKASAIPTEKHLLAWARWVAGEEWKRCGTFAHLRLGRQDREALAVLKVTVRLRFMDFDCDAGIYTIKDVRSFTVERVGDELRVLS